MLVLTTQVFADVGGGDDRGRTDAAVGEPSFQLVHPASARAARAARATWHKGACGLIAPTASKAWAPAFGITETETYQARTSCRG